MTTKSKKKTKVETPIVYTCWDNAGTQYWTLRREDSLKGSCIAWTGEYLFGQPAIFMLFPDTASKWYGYNKLEVAMTKLVVCEDIIQKFGG